MKTILIVEDNRMLGVELSQTLRDHYHTINAFSGYEAINILEAHTADLILLDMSLPDLPSAKILEMVRDESPVPIIVLTDGLDPSRVMGMLLAGANDYYVYPIENPVLIKRIEEQLSLDHELSENRGIRFKNIRFFPNEYRFELGGKVVDFSKKETEIMKLLLSNPNSTVSKEQLYASVWGDSENLDENTVNVHISSIRKKLRRIDPSVEYIQTVWGVGVRLAER
ncbi:response regulator transcription factor [Erysipelothrix aquatica]|uniref:response regulator transcription factor n=1 Tax=Erysipelothrix aquatica TaxID=2683714 RepID=UPI001359D896|nr:response regulator transcription factor [Erysipelothrix aquatica]